MKLNKRERKAQQLLAHYATCERLANYLGMENPDGKKITADCKRFQEENADTLSSATPTRGSGEPSQSEQAGHDFWLTRNRHGAGFWDGEWSEPEAKLLTDAAHAFGECDIYVTDDGELSI